MASLTSRYRTDEKLDLSVEILTTMSSIIENTAYEGLT
jgi:hypothetical protein